jgi:hypothetical protein
MSLSPVAFIAPSYTDFKGRWIKFYEPGTTTAKIIYIDPAGVASAAKVQINADGFIVSAAAAIVVPYLVGSYDAYIFVTEADADANDTSGAERIADNIAGSVSDIQTFDNIAEMLVGGLALGGMALCKRYYAGGQLVDGLLFNTVAGDTGTNDGGTFHNLSNGLQAQIVSGDTIETIHYGQVVDTTTDNSNAIDAAITYFDLVTQTRQAVFKYPAGPCRITRKMDFSQTGGERRKVTGGSDFEVTEFLVDWNGYGTGAGDPIALVLGEPSASYQTAIDVSGFQFTKGASSTRQPIGIHGVLAQSRISGMVFGSWNNITMSLASPQNNRLERFTTFSGGKAWEYKDATAVTVQQTGTALVATGSIFSTADVGHTVNVWGISPNTIRRKVKILAFVSSTEVTVDVTFTDGTARELYFGCPLVSMTATSTALTADAPTFSANDVGLIIYVKSAGESGRLLRASISAFVSTTEVTLSIAASTTIALEEFTTPAVELYDAPIGGGSDNTFGTLQIENHVGVGLVLQDQDILTFNGTKIHGEQTAAPDRYSLSPIWIEQSQGVYQGSFDAQYLGEHKVYAVFQTSVFDFNSLSMRTAYDERILRVDARATGFEGGLVQFSNISIAGANPNSADIELLIDDVNTSPKGHVLTGKVSFNEFNKTVQYNAKLAGASGSVFEASDVTWNGTSPTGGTERYQFSKVGNLVFFDFRLDYGVAGSSNSSVTIAIPSDMPVVNLSGATASEIIKTLYGAMSTDNTGATDPNLSKSYLRGDGAGSAEIILTLNSSSVSARFAAVSGFYTTDL